MIISDDEAQGRLDSAENLATQLVEVRKLKEGGKRLGQVSVPPALRSLIASIAVQGDEKQSDIAEVFDVSQPSVSNYSRGMIGDRREEALEKAIESSNLAEQEKKEREWDKQGSKIDDAHQAALDVMMLSLKGLGDKMADKDVIGSMKPKEVSRIAADMSKIVSVATGQDKKDSVINNTKVIVYAPQQRKETSYDVIDA